MLSDVVDGIWQHLVGLKTSYIGLTVMEVEYLVIPQMEMEAMEEEATQLILVELLCAEKGL